MGAWICKRAPPKRILFMGLDAAGKTTLLYQMKLGEVVTTIPTIGFNVETVSFGGTDIVCWDIGGRDKIRPLYRHYMVDMTAMVYVVDSTDKERIDDAFEELEKYYLNTDESRDKVCMVLANKQDLEEAMTVQEVEDVLKKKFPDKAQLSQTFFVCPISARTGDGIHEAFQCLMEQVELKKSPSQSDTGGLISVDYSRRAVTEEESEPGQLSSAGHVVMKRLVKDPVSFIKSALFY